ncbi:MAG: efflux RND transporter permease subunit, partial [Gammaproteobacteria bacterium]
MAKQDSVSLGVSGRMARFFLCTEITPLLALVGLLIGVLAIAITPREEEPQIQVTFANVFIPFPGASAKEVESVVTSPAERIVSEIEGVKHVYSASSPGMAALTVRFKVGEDRTDAIVRLYNAFYSNQDWWPAASGVGQPLIKPKGIDDVPVVAGTLWSENPAISPADLLRIAHTIQNELQRVPGTRDIDIIGAPTRVVHVLLDPHRLAAFQLSLSVVQSILSGANTSSDAGAVIAHDRQVQVQAGRFLRRIDDIADLVVGLKAGAPVFLRDVATVTEQADQPESYVRFGMGPAAATVGLRNVGSQPALTIAVSKKPGENAVDVANAVMSRFEAMRGIYIPDDIHITVTRNYGLTAEDKAQTLIKKLLFATLSVVVLVVLSLGKREAVVVGAAVVVTLAMTLFASWAWGFTLNRVSLFALIFSIGILVDDAIVVVENIHRHRQKGELTLTEIIPMAVDEVGGPTILATFTVIAALLPMAFVTGLMGPYMRPIPINASMGMLLSLVVAFVFTPWLYRRLFLRVGDGHAAPLKTSQADPFQRFFSCVMTPFLRGRTGLRARWFLLATLCGLILLSMATVVTRAVVMKMLPFDNKSEFQVMVDMPEGTSLEDTQRTLQAVAAEIERVPEVTTYQLYAGASAPINFNGLVRQYYLREQANEGDIQVNLVDKKHRDRQSHDIARAVRASLRKIAERDNANIKIVEAPPGPPVLAPLVAEIYGLDYAGQQTLATRIRTRFAAVDDVVDIDDTLEAQQAKQEIHINRSRAAHLQVAQQDIVQTIRTALSGADVGYFHDEQARVAVPIRVELPQEQQNDLDVLGLLRVRAQNGVLVPLSELTYSETVTRDQTIYHKDLLPVVYVMGDVAGETDSPLYGLASIASTLADVEPEIQQFYTQTPSNPYAWSVKWDGEWQITFETFRDMGVAYAVGLILIYLLVVAQFRSYGLPLIIMAPIPLTVIGILPGHLLFGQPFTAPSLIGMIALAGIIVRNSILLVDFIRQEVASGKSLQVATISASAVRARPIALTAAAAMFGGF